LFDLPLTDISKRTGLPEEELREAFRDLVIDPASGSFEAAPVLKAIVEVIVNRNPNASMRDLRREMDSLELLQDLLGVRLMYASSSRRVEIQVFPIDPNASSFSICIYRSLSHEWETRVEGHDV
jgi:hypothetical protein